MTLRHTTVTIEISTDRDRMDVGLIHDYLSRESYWASGIPRELVERSLDGSLCFGAFDNGRQIAFARVITDRATFAYLADVFVVPTHRGRGIATELIAAILTHPDVRDVRRWHLVTRDAQPLYAQAGFRPVEQPERHMERVRQNAYAPESLPDECVS